MKTYNWEGVNPDGYFLDKLEPIPSALPSFQKLFQVSATALSIDRKSGSAGMPRPISYAVFCLKKKRQYSWPLSHGWPPAIVTLRRTRSFWNRGLSLGPAS